MTAFSAHFSNEQFHWYALVRTEQTDAAITDFRKMFPNVPVGLPEGAMSKRSSYLHLIICTLELDALRALIGQRRAQRVIGAREYYTWVYKQVLHDDGPIRLVLDRHELIVM